MKRIMFMLLVAIVLGTFAGIIGYFITDWEYAPIVGGMISGTITVFISDDLYDKLFISKDKVKTVLQEMGED